MKEYIDLGNRVMVKGEIKEDRTGVGTISTFGEQLVIDISKGFPLLTTKSVPFRHVLSELLWFLKGKTNVNYLRSRGNNIWTRDAYRHYLDNFEEHIEPPSFEEFLKMIDRTDHDLGKIYGYQWRKWIAPQDKLFDQIDLLQQSLKNDPNGRRHIVNAWNVGELEEMALPPCHVMTQFYVSNDGRLHCHLYQRSADYFLGVPFNIASYSTLVIMLATVLDYKPGTLTTSYGDIHIYSNHVEQVKELLNRKPKQLPTLEVRRKPENVWDFTEHDFKLYNYDPHPTIKAPLNVGLDESEFKK